MPPRATPGHKAVDSTGLCPRCTLDVGFTSDKNVTSCRRDRSNTPLQALNLLNDPVFLEHCPIQPWFEQVQRVKVTVRQGHIDVRELAQRPGLGIEFDMDLVRSRSQHLPMQASRYTTIDGSTPFL